MKHAVTLVLLVVTAGFAAEVGGFGGPMVAGGMPDFSKLNAELDRYNLDYFYGSRGPELSSPSFFIGGQGSGMLEGISVGGWGGGFFQEASGDSSKVLIAYGMGHLEMGYRFSIADFLLLGPMAHIGGGGVALNIGPYTSGGFGPPDQDSDTTDQDFFDEDNSYQAGKGFVTIGASVDGTFLFPLGEQRTAFSGINLKAGYLYTIYDSGWYDEHQRITDTPDFNFTGPFLSIGLVFGGKSSDEDDTDEEWEEWQ